MHGHVESGILEGDVGDDVADIAAAINDFFEQFVRAHTIKGRALFGVRQRETGSSSRSSTLAVSPLFIGRTVAHWPVLFNPAFLVKAGC